MRTFYTEFAEAMFFAIDPGATRCGYALLDGDELVASGVLFTPRQYNQTFQGYRLTLENDIFFGFQDIIDTYKPSLMINEILPPKSSSSFGGSTQSYLVNCVVTVFHICAIINDIQLVQVSSRSVQKSLGIKNSSGRITKVGVKKGVIKIMPELLSRYKTILPDEIDAIAIALYAKNQSFEFRKELSIEADSEKLLI